MEKGHVTRDPIHRGFGPIFLGLNVPGDEAIVPTTRLAVPNPLSEVMPPVAPALSRGFEEGKGQRTLWDCREKVVFYHIGVGPRSTFGEMTDVPLFPLTQAGGLLGILKGDDSIEPVKHRVLALDLVLDRGPEPPGQVVENSFAPVVEEARLFTLHTRN